jgi:hypothetical protein
MAFGEWGLPRRNKDEEASENRAGCDLQDWKWIVPVGWPTQGGRETSLWESDQFAIQNRATFLSSGISLTRSSVIEEAIRQFLDKGGVKAASPGAGARGESRARRSS